MLRQVGDVFLTVFDLDNCAFALLVASNLALFGLFLYLPGQVRANNPRNEKLVGALAVQRHAERLKKSARSPGKNLAKS